MLDDREEDGKTVFETERTNKGLPWSIWWWRWWRELRFKYCNCFQARRCCTRREKRAGALCSPSTKWEGDCHTSIYSPAAFKDPSNLFWRYTRITSQVRKRGMKFLVNELSWDPSFLRATHPSSCPRHSPWWWQLQCCKYFSKQQGWNPKVDLRPVFLCCRRLWRRWSQTQKLILAAAEKYDKDTS